MVWGVTLMGMNWIKAWGEGIRTFDLFVVRCIWRVSAEQKVHSVSQHLHFKCFTGLTTLVSTGHQSSLSIIPLCSHCWDTIQGQEGRGGGARGHTQEHEIPARARVSRFGSASTRTPLWTTHTARSQSNSPCRDWGRQLSPFRRRKSCRYTGASMSRLRRDIVRFTLAYASNAIALVVYINQPSNERATEL